MSESENATPLWHVARQAWQIDPGTTDHVWCQITSGLTGSGAIIGWIYVSDTQEKWYWYPADATHNGPFPETFSVRFYALNVPNGISDWVVYANPDIPAGVLQLSVPASAYTVKNRTASSESLIGYLNHTTSGGTSTLEWFTGQLTGRLDRHDGGSWLAFSRTQAPPAGQGSFHHLVMSSQ